MKPKFKRLCSAGAALVVAVAVAPLLSTSSAFAAGSLSGPATVKSAGGAANLSSGNSDTVFTLSLPAGASCPGDSANGGYRWQTYMVPATVDPGTLTFGSSGPIPVATGAAFRQPLFTNGGSPIVNKQTANASVAGGPGPILNIPDMYYAVFTPGQIPAGAYNLGVACTLGGASATQMSSYWNVTKTFTTDATNGGTAQVTWVQGTVANAPVLTSPLTSGDSTLTAAFTPGAAIAGNPATTSYTATATPTAGPVVTATGAGSPITIPGLTNGTSYSVTVHATNSVGNSAESNAVSGTPAIPPRPPVSSLTATPGTNAVTLNWTAPSGGPAPTGYQVTTSPAAGTQAPPNPVAGLTATISGLTAGTNYTFTVVPLQASGPNGQPTSVSAIPQSAQTIIQNVTVVRPTGAIVLTQVCGNYGALPADMSASIGFPTGSLPALPAVSGGTAPTTTAGGSTADPAFAGYPYPTLADGTPNPTYPTYCGVNLGNAQFIKSGPGYGRFFAASGRMNQVTIVDTRDTDTGWNIVGTMSRFVKSTDSTKSFSGSQLGWDPVQTSTTPQFTDSDGNSYTQTATSGVQVEPNSPNASGLSTGRTLGSAAAVNCSGATPNVCTGGLGTAFYDARLKLLIPVTAVSGTYNATLSFSVI